MRKMNRIPLIFFLVWIVCAAEAEAPVAFSDIPLRLPDPVNVELSVQNGYVFLSTDWSPVFDDTSVSVQFTNQPPVYLYPDEQGRYKSLLKVNTDAGKVTEYSFISSQPDTNAQEIISMDHSGAVLLSEIAQNGCSFSYIRDQDQQYHYSYTVDKADSVLPLVEYSVTYSDTGKVQSYRLGGELNTEVTYKPDGTVLMVEALVPYSDQPDTAYRIRWDADGGYWYNPSTSEIVDYPPYVAPVEPEPVTPGSDSQDPNPDETETGQDHTHTPSASPAPDKKPSAYTVSAPPLTVGELKIPFPASALHHLPLGQKAVIKGMLFIDDLQYESVSVLSDERVPMTKVNGQWMCAAPKGHYAIVLKNASGLITMYLEDGQMLTMHEADTALELQADGSYAYDGTGRENVTAAYNADGDLVSYSYHNADGTKSVSYNPYGEVLYYSASSADGYTYRYQNMKWERLEKSGSWKECKKPSDVNPSDLPPLLLLERAKTVTGTWYPNNTAGVIGVSLRDKFPGLTKKWYHVLPVDLTIQGTQSFKLVASNLHYIGRVFVTVNGDQVVVTYRYADGLIFPKKDMFRWFTDLSEITHDFLEDPTDSMDYGRPYSISSDLNGSPVALLFVCNRVTYRQPVWNNGTMLVRYWPNIDSVKEHRMKAEDMLQRMMSGD